MNSQTSFTNRLALPITLGSSSDWEIGLSEITYTPPQHTIIQAAVIDVINDLNVLIHCDLITPQLVGSEIPCLFRTTICPSQIGRHLIHNVYCLPVEKKNFFSIRIELSFWSHDHPSAFVYDDTPTPTKVVLHFRLTKWEMLPAGIDTCPVSDK